MRTARITGLVVGLLATCCAVGADAEPVGPSSAEPAVPSADLDGAFALRGYRGVRHESRREQRGPDTFAIHTFAFDDSEYARRFVSKIYSDYELTSGNNVKAVTTPKGTADIIDLAGTGAILPLLLADATTATVVVGPGIDRVVAQAGSLLPGPPLRRADLTHPLYLDKWDRYCLGCWTQISDVDRDSDDNTLDSFAAWLGKHNVTSQLNPGYLTTDGVTNDNLLTLFRRYFSRHGVNYQRVEWLANQVDLFNRNPFLTTGPNPHVAWRGDYYGERGLAANPMRQVQNAVIRDVYRRTAADTNQMALLDPDGEIGPFDTMYWGLYGPLNRREFGRFLKEVRKLTLPQVSERYTARPDAYASWDDVPLADWRRFYGWTDGAQDLAGEWRFRRDDNRLGFTRGWALPSFDDSDWVRLHYPGEALVFGLPSAGKALWMRKTFTPTGTWPDRVYLSLAPLTERPVQVFLNGEPLGTLDPRFHTAWTWGQFDITQVTKAGRPLCLALRFAAGDCPQGPIFLTSRPAEEFPTADPLVNARRWDHMEFVDWAVAQAVATTLDMLRSVDVDRPIKVHAYGASPWGWETVARYGGYSHHTGSGPGWQWTEPKQYGAAYGLQDSSEPGGPVQTRRDFRGIWGSLIFMGKNAHDYFLCVRDIKGDPAKRAYFEAKAPHIRVMGRANVLISPVAAIRTQLRYRGEFDRWESWRYGVVPVRGGEMFSFLNELTVRHGRLDQFRAIIDEGNDAWDQEMATALQAYVEHGGILLLNRLSGLHTFIERDKGAGPGLAGIRLGEAPGKAGSVSITGADARLGDVTGDFRAWSRDGTLPSVLEPLPGTDVLGTWPDGGAALTRRALGRGYVYCFGSNTYPRELIAGLTQAQGLATYASAEGGFDLLRTLRANNGTEDLLMVRGKDGKEVTIRWTLEYSPARIYDPVTGQGVPATIEGNTVTVALSLDDWDFRWLAARRPVATAAFAHWFRRQTEMWSGLVPDAKAPEAPLYRHLDLNHNWRIVHSATMDEARALLSLDDAAARLRPSETILWDDADRAAGPCALYRQDFELPPRWEKDSILQLAVRGSIHDSRMHGFSGTNEILVNGQPVWSGERLDSSWFDVTARLRPGANRLEILHRGPGLMPSLMLVRSAVPDRVVDLSGEWRCVQDRDATTTDTAVAVPGTARGVFLYRDVEVPEDLTDQEVWLRVEPPCAVAIVNGRLRYWDIGHSPVFPQPQALELDITPDLRCGQVNRIVLANSPALRGWGTSEYKLSRVELRVFAPGKWSPDGTGTRAVLSAKELEAVARDANRVRQYTMVPSPAAQSTAVAPAAAPAPPVTVPVPILDLAPAANGLQDRGPNQVPATPQGTVTPFADAGGRIRGVYLHGECEAPGTIQLPTPFFRANLQDRDFTIRAWVMPIAIDAPGGALFHWFPNLTWEIQDHDTRISMPSSPSRRQNVETVITQRRWQSLALAVKGRQSDLYLNGIPVSRQTWNLPITGNDAPVHLGSIQAQRDFLNAKLAAFTIYGEALSPEVVRAVYESEREAYQTRPADLFLENDLLRLKMTPGCGDESDLPGQVTVATGVTFTQEDGRPVMVFDGVTSHLIVRDNGRDRLFSRPYAFIIEVRPEPGASGALFRRHHANCFDLAKDGTLVFDANIGRNNRVSFPGAVRHGDWNRIVLVYDGRKVRLEVNGVQVGERAYEGARHDPNSDFPIVFMADNTWPGFPEARNIRGQVRELRVAPWFE